MFKLVYPTWDPVKLHDWFNLVVIALLNLLNVAFLATGQGFGVFWTATVLYFLFDTVFVGIYPQSVKTPVVILSHHLCTSLYMLIPYYYPQYHWCMAYCMLVEANTWLLIARRRIGGRLIEAAFYVSWVGLRNIFYPYLIYAFYKEWQRETAACGSPWNPIIITPVCQAFLTGLNYHWTLQLLLKLQRPAGAKRLGPGGRKGAAAAVGRGCGAPDGPPRTSALAALADVSGATDQSGCDSGSDTGGGKEGSPMPKRGSSCAAGGRGLAGRRK